MTVLRLLAFIAPLSLESFAVAAALGAAGPTTAQRWRITALFVAFEGGMPMIGPLAGAPLARAVGGLADYLAAAGLAAVGIWLLLEGPSGVRPPSRRHRPHRPGRRLTLSHLIRSA